MNTPKAPPKSYCVRFTSITCYKLTLWAASPSQAIAKAKRKWRYGNCEAFRAFSGNDEAWDAEEE